MTAGLHRFILRWLGRTTVVRIADCVHYTAFRYGRGECHPYENYAQGLAAGDERERVRTRFVDFLRHYRPRTLEEAIGLGSGGRRGLWEYPWVGASPRPVPGWYDDPAEGPDIVTHFSERGILYTRIEQEYAWLEQSFDSIKAVGYQPERFRGHIEARCLINRKGERRYLILDGNHRLSALSALGHQTVPVRISSLLHLVESRVARWRRVRNGDYSIEEALHIFHAYFVGNHRPKTTDVPASVIFDRLASARQPPGSHP